MSRPGLRNQWEEKTRIEWRFDDYLRPVIGDDNSLQFAYTVRGPTNSPDSTIRKSGDTDEKRFTSTAIRDWTES